MQYYNVPQDVEVADQIIGPLNLKQFGFVMAGLGFAIGLFSLIKMIGLPVFIGGILAIFPLSIFLALAFLPYNSRPLDYYIFPVFQFFTTDKLLLWEKEEMDTNAALAAIGGLKEKVNKDKAKKNPEAPVDTGVESKHGVREELSHIKKVAALLDGGLEEIDDIGPKTAFDGTAGRNKAITDTLSEASAKVAKTREPVIAQVATLSPTEAPKTSMPDLSAYSFQDMETAEKEDLKNG